jgi:flagellar basal body rod protein FlgG
MASEISTIQSLKAVDTWIDVINANINGGVRTAFKSSRLKFSGSNVDVARAGSSTSLPLQFPEPGLTTANTVIDFSQGAVTASTEETHLAIQGPGMFRLVAANLIDMATGYPIDTASPVTMGGTHIFIRNSAAIRWDGGQIYYTRDGEFSTFVSPVNPNIGFLRHNASGLLVLRRATGAQGDAGPQTGTNGCRAVFWDSTAAGTSEGTSNSLQMALSYYTQDVDHLARVTNPQILQYSRYGSTIFQEKWDGTALGDAIFPPNQAIRGSLSLQSEQPTILQKSLEASNASMTQSVPELSLAQKLFSALTKVLQTKQTNVDGVLNLVR